MAVLWNKAFLNWCTPAGKYLLQTPQGLLESTGDCHLLETPVPDCFWCFRVASKFERPAHSTKVAFQLVPHLKIMKWSLDYFREEPWKRARQVATIPVWHRKPQNIQRRPILWSSPNSANIYEDRWNEVVDSLSIQVVTILHHLLRLEPSCRLVDFGAGACKLASQLYRYIHLYVFMLKNRIHNYTTYVCASSLVFVFMKTHFCLVLQHSDL